MHPVLAVVAAALLVRCGAPVPSPPATHADIPSTSTVPSALTEPTDDSRLAFAPTGPTQEARVARVVDGDTIVVDIEGREHRVRYIGVDTPEALAPGQPIERMGRQASAANAALVAGKHVVLEKDVSQTDQFGRLLRYVWLRHGERWLLVNLELVRQGFARVATFPPDVKYVELYLGAEREAREAGRGLWSPTPTR